MDNNQQCALGGVLYITMNACFALVMSTGAASEHARLLLLILSPYVQSNRSVRHASTRNGNGTDRFPPSTRNCQFGQISQPVDSVFLKKKLINSIFSSQIMNRPASPARRAWFHEAADLAACALRWKGPRGAAHDRKHVVPISYLVLVVETIIITALVCMVVW
jgi:hypothetical protein